MLNHAPADTCQDLNTQSAIATPSLDIREDEPSLDEVQKAIRKLKNGRAAGPDGTPPELLKYAEEPVSRALHELFRNVWITSSGRKASLCRWTRERAHETSAPVIGLYPSFQFREKYSPTSCGADWSHC